MFDTDFDVDSAGLPKDEFGEIETGAKFGYSYAVVIEYNTNAEGRWVNLLDCEPVPTTVHGLFFDKEEALVWMAAYPDDTEINDMRIISVNNVR